jgi:Spx/MgsR family transcriptional regulator
LIRLYGISNCDTVRKARRWLDAHDIEYSFHDFREHGLAGDLVDQWLEALGWEQVVNRRSSTWKQLDAAERESMDAIAARSAILAHPTLVKRPVLDTGTDLQIGFSEQQYRDIFKKHTL